MGDGGTWEASALIGSRTGHLFLPHLDILSSPGKRAAPHVPAPRGALPSLRLYCRLTSAPYHADSAFAYMLLLLLCLLLILRTILF